MDTAASSGGPADGYAIPIGTARAIADRIASGVDDATIHQGPPAFLGVSMADGASGATVAGVLSGTAAQGVGPAAGDVIASVDGAAIAPAADLSAAMAGHEPGDRVTVTWTTAGGASQSTSVSLGAGPAD